eukprot:6116812-Amphidinium_carterae.1
MGDYLHMRVLGHANNLSSVYPLTPACVCRIACGRSLDSCDDSVDGADDDDDDDDDASSRSLCHYAVGSWDLQDLAGQAKALQESLEVEAEHVSEPLRASAMPNGFPIATKAGERGN